MMPKKCPQKNAMASLNDRMTALSFVALISLPMVGMLLNADSAIELNEIRDKSQRPKLVFSQAALSDFPSQFDSFYNDDFGFRDALVRLHAHICLDLFDVSPLPKRIMVGKQGWIFLKDAIYRPQEQTYDDAAAIAEIEAVSAALIKDGKRPIIFAAPHKPTLYKEYLSASGRKLHEGSEGNLARFRKKTGGIPIDGYFELWDSMQSKKDSLDEPIYHPKDSHWNSLGASVAAAELINHIQPNLWNPQGLKRDDNYQHAGDLHRMMGLADTFSAPTAYVKIPGRTVSMTQSSSNDSAILDFEVSQSSMDLLPETIFIHDSYGKVLMGMLPPYFSKIHFVPYEAFSNNILAVKERYKSAKIVVIEIVERDMYWAFDGYLRHLLEGLDLKV
jgi:alginate O-acetyltransferase complex protein AlgJ